jgi:WD40 repeat protein
VTEIMLTTLFLFLSIVTTDPVRPLTSKHAEPVLGLAVSPDRTQLASLSRDGTILIWDIKAQREMHRFTTSKLARTIAWPELRRLLTAGSLGVDVVDPATGKVQASHRVGQRSDAAAISPDGRFAAVANTHFTGMLIDTTTGKSIKPYPAPSESTYAMDISSDSGLLALAGRSPDPDAITLLETKTFTAVLQWQTRLKDAVGLRFAPNNQLLASTGDSDVVNLWHVADGTLAYTLPLAQPRAATLGFSPDSRCLVACSGVPAFQLAPHHYGYIPPDSARHDKGTPTLQCWDLTTRKQTWRSPTLASWATSILFLDDRRFVTGHYDGTLRFWDVSR